MNEVLVFGADSLVGSHFAASAADRVHAAGRSDPRAVGVPVASFTPVDLRDARRLAEVVDRSPAPAIVNFAAATDVDGVERERPAPGSAPAGVAFALNALAPEVIARTAAASGRRFVQLSTDFVFDGRDGPYSESAEPSALSAAVSWYGWTKGEGERRARQTLPETTVLRIAYPFRSHFPSKSDFARNLVARRRLGTLPPLFVDQQMTPTWVPDVTRAIHALLERPSPGTFHAASPTPTTPHAFGRKLFERLEGHPVSLPEGSMEEFLRRSGVTPRPRHGGLRSERLIDRGVPMTGWAEGVELFVAEGGGA